MTSLNLIYAFTTNYEQVWCYCLEDSEVKLFRVSRIGAVEILPEEIEIIDSPEFVKYLTGQVEKMRNKIA